MWKTSHWMAFLPMDILDNVKFITFKVFEATNSSRYGTHSMVCVWPHHEFFCMTTIKCELEWNGWVILFYFCNRTKYWLNDKRISTWNTPISVIIWFDFQFSYESLANEDTQSRSKSCQMKLSSFKFHSCLQYLRLLEVLHSQSRLISWKTPANCSVSCSKLNSRIDDGWQPQWIGNYFSCAFYVRLWQMI